MSSYVPPPPPSSRGGSGDNCFKWGALGCIGIVILFAGMAVLVWLTAGKFIGGAMKDSMQVAIEMNNLRMQIIQYKQDTGKYPDRLEDLVPKYIRSTADLKLSSHPEGPQYTYHKPGPNAQQSDVVLEYTLGVEMQEGQRVEVPVMMRLDGRTQQGKSQVIQGHGRAAPPVTGRPARPAGATR